VSYFKVTHDIKPIISKEFVISANIRSHTERFRHVDPSQQPISTWGLEMHQTWKRREHRHVIVYHRFCSWHLDSVCSPVQVVCVWTSIPYLVRITSSANMPTPTPWPPIPRMASASVQTIRSFSLPLVCSRKFLPLSLDRPSPHRKRWKRFSMASACNTMLLKQLKHAKWLLR